MSENNMKMPIWGDSIPYNTGEAKSELLDLSPNTGFLKFAIDVFGSRVAKNASGLDNRVWQAEVKRGYASEFMDDVPMIEPYFAGGDIAVIVAPGGGFCYLERENEGAAVARFLQSKGINAFVLTYRLNPYKAPVYWVDMQRAVRFVRNHAGDWHLDKNKVGVIGFSAGAYTAGALTLFQQNAALDVPGYIPDLVDQEDGLPSFSGLIYPLGDMVHNQNLLIPFIREDFWNIGLRTEALQKYSLTEHLLNNPDTPQFLCYGDKDPLIKSQRPYAERLASLGGKHKILALHGASHGFGMRSRKYHYWADEFVSWVKGLFAAEQQAS